MSQWSFGTDGRDLGASRGAPFAAVGIAVLVHFALFALVPSCEEPAPPKKMEITAIDLPTEAPRGALALPEEALFSEDTGEPILPPDQVSRDQRVPAPAPATAQRRPREETPRARPQEHRVISTPQDPPDEVTPPAKRRTLPPAARIPGEPPPDEERDLAAEERLERDVRKKPAVPSYFLTDPESTEGRRTTTRSDNLDEARPLNEGPEGSLAEGGGRIMGGPTFDFWSPDDFNEEIGRAQAAFDKEYAEFEKWKNTDLGHGVICNTDGEWFVCSLGTIEACNSMYDNLCRFARGKEKAQIQAASIF